jgi:hypothetical protein
MEEDIMYAEELLQQQWPRLSYNEHKTTIEEEPVLTGAAGGCAEIGGEGSESGTFMTEFKSDNSESHDTDVAISSTLFRVWLAAPPGISSPDFRPEA